MGLPSSCFSMFAGRFVEKLGWLKIGHKGRCGNQMMSGSFCLVCRVYPDPLNYCATSL